MTLAAHDGLGLPPPGMARFPTFHTADEFLQYDIPGDQLVATLLALAVFYAGHLSYHAEGHSSLSAHLAASGCVVASACLLAGGLSTALSLLLAGAALVVAQILKPADPAHFRGADAAEVAGRKAAVLEEPEPGEDVTRVGLSPGRVQKLREGADADVIVVGSGLSGLAAASLLARSGQRVVVLEQNEVAGGCTHTFSAKGFEFDTGLHYVGGGVGDKAAPLRKLFDTVCDGLVDWAPMEAAYDEAICRHAPLAGAGTYDPAKEERWEFGGAAGATERRLQREFPAEKAAITAFFAECGKVEASSRGFWATKMAPRWLAQLLASISGARFLGYATQSTAHAMSRLGCSEKLAGVLTYLWGDYGLPPQKSSFALTAMLHTHFLNGGGNYPVGGSAVLARAIIPSITRSGGAVFVRADVSDVLVEDGRAVGVRVNGSAIYAQRIISGVGWANTCRLLARQQQGVPSSLQLKPLPGKGREGEGAAALPPSCAMVYLFVGVKQQADPGAPSKPIEIPSKNSWLFPEMAHDANCAEADARDPSKDAVPAAGGEGGNDVAPLPLPGVFVSWSSSKDPAWAGRKGEEGRGTHVALVVAPVPWKWFAPWSGTKRGQRPAEYLRLKARLQQQLLEIVLSVAPQIEPHVAYTDLGTPLSNNEFLGTAEGEVYGLSHGPARFSARAQADLHPQTELGGLFLTGQDTITDGISAAVSAGMLSSMRAQPSLLWSNLNLLI